MEAFWAIAGATAGVAQAGLIARSSRAWPRALGFVLRFGLVAAVLFVAARYGQLAPSAGGWLLGFALACVAVYRRLR